MTFGALPALLLLAAACSGDGDASTPTATATPAPATATVAPAATPDPLGALEPDGDRAFEHVRVLTEDFGARVAGSPEEVGARDYLREELESYGYDVTIQPFPFDGSAYRPGRVLAGADAYSAIAFEGSVEGAATGPLVFAGLGEPEEFPVNARGAVVLIERGELDFRVKAENAVAAGAAGVVIYNNEDGPLVGDANSDVPIPMVGISRDEGEALHQRLSGGETIVATVEVVEAAGEAYNVVAKPPGATTCDTITGGHYDAVIIATGADDNASGTASVVELARVVAARDVPGTHCFALFGAEEFGLFGSQHYVAQLSEEELNALDVMINLDVVGTDMDLTLIGDEDMVEVARIEADELGLDATPGGVPSGSSSDHASFQDAGVPVLFLYRANGRIHTTDDVIGSIDADRLGETVAVALGSIEALAAP